MTAKRIQEVALAHFAKYGYDGSSLANIAEEVGIKKPSIYAHFKGKEDLFLHVVQEVFHEELAFVRDYFALNSHSPLHARLYEMLAQYQERYERNDKMKFWLRMSYFPPPALYDEIMEQVYAYLDQLELLLAHIFTEASATGEIDSIDANQAASAFMCLLDGNLVEMLYGGADRFRKRLDASWTLFWRGICK